MDKEYIINNLLDKNGNLSSRKMKKHNITESREELYAVHTSGTAACTCGTPRRLISFLKGFHVCSNRLCPTNTNRTCITCGVSFYNETYHKRCSICRPKLIEEAFLKTASATEQEVIQVITKFLKENISPDRWSNLLKAENKPVYSYLKNTSNESNKSISNIAYDLLYPDARSVCECGKKTKYDNFYKGYKESCSIKCSVINTKRCTKMNKTIISNTIEKNIGLASYYNPNYKNTKEASNKFNTTHTIKEYRTLTEFDLVVPFYSFLDPDNFTERYKYYINGLETVKKCLYCNDPLDSINKTFCDAVCSSNHYGFLPFKDKVLKLCEQENTELISDLKETRITIKCSCGKLHTHNRTVLGRNSTSKCYDCRPGVSKKNSRYEGELKELFPNFSHAARFIGAKDIDLLDKSAGFGIEFNGMVWHSHGTSKHSMFNNPDINENRHLEKTLLCEEKDIELFQIFEFEFQKNTTKKDIWISMINDKLNKSTSVPVNKTIIKEVSKEESKIFLDENHIQGYINSNINIGLYYMDELISLISLNTTHTTTEWELTRLCSLKNHNVAGGFNKLLMYFEKTFKPRSLLSYANRRWSNGGVYEELGFEFNYSTEPNSFYFKHNQPFIVYSADQFDVQKEIMFDNDYRLFYDCGSKVYTKKYKEGAA